jgi:uncharacterized delta-60 repeat protein
VPVAIAIQPDGKILAGGYGDAGGRNATRSFALARFTTTGSLDTTFGNGGITLTSFGKRSPGEAHAMVLYPKAGTANDGKIVLGGNSPGGWTLARYNPNGALDTSFGSAGTASSGNGILDGLTLQADGKILAVGVTGTNGNNLIVARYNANGTLDATFGSGGEVISHVGPDSEGRSVAVQGDGKIVVGGRFTSAPVLGLTEFAVFRYNANGTPDTTFGNGTGHTQFDTPPWNSTGAGCLSVVLQPDGKIVAGGLMLYVNGTDQTPEGAVARFNPDGSFDSTFGTAGKELLPDPAQVNALALDANGRIVIVGNDVTGTVNEVGRLNANGSLDTTFNGTGLVQTTTGNSYSPYALVIQPADGKIVMTCVATVNGVAKFAVTRYLATDPTIGSFTASPNPVTSGSTTTLTVSNITDVNPSSITQVAIYVDSNNDGKLEPGSDTLIGYATQTSPGVWTFTYTVNLTPGTYTLFAQAEDNYTLFSDPFALTLTVQ